MRRDLSREVPAIDQAFYFFRSRLIAVFVFCPTARPLRRSIDGNTALTDTCLGASGDSVFRKGSLEPERIAAEVMEMLLLEVLIAAEWKLDGDGFAGIRPEFLGAVGHRQRTKVGTSASRSDPHCGMLVSNVFVERHTISS